MGWIEAFRLNMRCYRIIHELDKWFLPLQTINSVISAVSPLVNLFMGALIINQLAAGLYDIPRVSTYVVVTVGLNFIFNLTRNLIQKKLAVLQVTFRPNYLTFLSKHYMDLDYEHIENPEVNAALSDIEGKTMSTSAGVIDVFLRYGSLVQGLAGIVAAIAVLWGMFVTGAPIVDNFLTSPWATALLAALLGFNILLTVFRQKHVQKAVEFIRNEAPKVNSLFGYYMKYIQHGEAAKDIRIFNQQPVINNVLEKFLATREGWFRYYSVRGRESAISEFASAIFGGLAYLLIGLRALWGMYGVGNVVAYVGAVRNLSANISALVNALAQTKANAAFLPQVYEYLDLPNKKRIDNKPLEAANKVLEPVSKPFDVTNKAFASFSKPSDSAKYTIEFHNVSFKYPGGTDYALRNISLKFQAGQKMAIVGQNGSGKTTMIKLLCRLYEPTKGKIILDGVDIKEYNYKEYLPLFSVVFQDFKLFGFTLGQNLACNYEYDTPRANRALSEAGFETPPSLTKGLETPLLKDLEKEGITLSGGESQKAAIARAFYRNAAFMLLDEPTAALDPQSEFEIYNRLNNTSGEKTIVYISHRLASCRFCTNIIVLHEGKMVQSGSHETLTADKNGKYLELWNAQAQYYNE